MHKERIKEKIISLFNLILFVAWLYFVVWAIEQLLGNTRLSYPQGLITGICITLSCFYWKNIKTILLDMFLGINEETKRFDEMIKKRKAQIIKNHKNHQSSDE